MTHLSSTAGAKKNVVAKKLTLIIILLSAFLIMLTSAIQLYYVHEHEITELNEILDYIHNSHLTGITEAAWRADDTNVKNYLNRFLHFSDIEYLEITKNRQTLWSVGTPPDISFIERHYPLIKTYNGAELNIGQLHIISGSRSLQKAMLKNFTIIFLSNTLIIIIVALMLLWLIRSFITRHLSNMAHYARELDIDSDKISTLTLQRTGAIKDELDEVANAINLLVLRHNKALSTAKKNEQRSLLILDAASDGICGLSAEGKITFINQSAINMLGFSRETLLHNSSHPLIHHSKPDGTPYPESECKMLTPFVSGKTITVTDEQLWHKNGIAFDVEYTSVPLIRGDTVQETVVTFTDVSERRRQENLLHTISKGVSGDYGQQFLLSLIKHLYASLHCDYAFLGIYDELANKVGTIVHFSHGELQNNFSYSLENTPCQTVINNGVSMHTENIPQDYPDDKRLIDLEIISYAAVPLKNSSGQVTALLTILHKQPLKNSQETLHLMEIFGSRAAAELQRLNDEESLHLAAIAFETHEAIAITDAKGIVLRVNNSFTETTGYSNTEIIGKEIKTLKSGKHDKTFYKEMWFSINRDGFWEGEIWNKRKDGDIYPVWQTITAVKNHHGTIRHYVTVFLDISEQKRAKKQIHQLSNYDRLTNLPNRGHMMNLIDHAISDAKEKDLFGTVIIFDINDLRAINDSLGHSFGDNILKIIAARLRTALSAAGKIGRLGGDEFIMLLPALDKDLSKARTKALKLASIATQTLNDPLHVGNHSLTISACLGYSLFPFPEQGADTLLMQVDTALHKAKHAGPNCIEVFRPEMHEIVERRLQIKNGMHHALENNEFSLYLQPQFDNDEKLVAAEALIRWLHPEQGIISPVDFIPLAEETGQIIEIGYWVLRESCAILQQEKCTLNTLAINVSPIQFHLPDFVEKVKQIIHNSGVDPARIELEITESVVISNLADIRVKMLALREIGIKFAIDDFGTGYSSLAYLSKLPISKIKIDQSFIIDLDKTSNDIAIIESIISIARNMNFSVIAEGVETKASFDLLKNKGCNYYQGYLFSKPISLDAFCSTFYNDDE